MSAEIRVTMYPATVEKIDRVLSARGAMPSPGGRSAPGLASPVDQARTRLVWELLDAALNAALGASR